MNHRKIYSHRHFKFSTKCLGVVFGVFCFYLAQACGLGHDSLETIHIKRINDGDTLTTTHPKRKIRLVLVNATEIDHKSPAKSQAMSREAKDFLSELADQHNNQASFYSLGKDKHKRQLGLISFDGAASVNSQLLESGLGFFTAFQEQDGKLSKETLTCHKQAETRAKKQQLGVWHQNVLGGFLLEAKKLNAYGFHIVEGSISKISSSRKGIFVDIDKKLKVFIPHSFKKSPYWKAELKKSQTIQVRGWVQKNRFKNQSPFFMKLSHPLMLEQNVQALL